MTDEETFLLILLFDGSKVDGETFEKRIENELQKYLERITWRLRINNQGNALLSIDGSLEDVSGCHAKVVKAFGDVPHFRLKDEAGNYIREQAYSILSRIEHGLRVFINRALIETFGFEWSGTAVQTRLPEKPVRDPQFPLNALETLRFSDLIVLVTSEISLWSPDYRLTAQDILELLADRESIEEIRSEVEERITTILLWDDVFSPYFADKEHWQKVKKQLTFMIRVRHKVMHHRPVHIWALKRLQEYEEELSELLESAEEELSAEFRFKITIEQSEAMTATIARSIADSMQPIIARSIADSMQPIIDSQRILSESFLPTFDLALRLTEAFPEMQERNQRMLSDMSSTLYKMKGIVSSTE